MSEPERRVFAAKMAELRAAFTGGGPAGTAFQFLAPMTAGRQMFAGTAAVALRNEYVQRPSGLLVPAAAARTPQPLDTVAVYLTFEELAGVAVPPRRMRDLLSRLGRGDVLLFAATWLGQIGAPGASSAQVDAAYLQLFDGELRQKVANLAHSGGRRLVVRQALLVLAKLALLVCPDQTADGINAADVLPLVPFALADHLGVSVDEGDPDAPQCIGDSPLTPEVVSNQHFNSPDGEAHITGRWVRQWTELPFEFPDERLGDLAALYQEATGTTLNDLSMVALVMWASASAGRPLLWHSYFDGLRMSAERVKAALRVVGATLPETTAAVRDDARRTGGAGLRWEFSAFGRHPVICFDDATLVIDPTLLLERAFGWLPFFDIEDYLKTRRDSRLGSFRCVVRKHAERYALEVLASLAPDAGGQRRIYTEADLKAAFGAKGVKHADAVIDYGDLWVVVEVTTHRLVRDTVAGLSDEALVGDVRRLAVDEGEQIASTIDQLRRAEERLTGHPAPPHRRFAPVVVATEGFPVNPITTTLLEEQLGEAGLLQDRDVLPLQVVDIAELERVEGLQESGGPSLAQLLLDKPNGSFAKTSLRDYLILERGLRPPRPARLDKLWTHLFQAAQRHARPAA